MNLLSGTTDHRDVSKTQWLIAVVTGLGLSVGVWWALVCGGGLVGGDTYTYFFPQKIVLAESFARGEIPLWHNLTGLGYPLHAESQAGVFYPTTQILYRILGVNAAYSANIVLHYWLAFVFAWRFARCQNVSHWPALLAAMIFVYGWFPARVSLEWSIIGGVWLPLSLWLTDRLLQQPSRRRFAVLAACLGIHLLAGHFTLAFITQLTICSYAGLKILLRKASEMTGRQGVRRDLAVVVGCVVVGLAAASVQLVPTFELKQMSQREGGGKEFDPAYGHMPPAYLTQVAASWWYWHSPEVKASGKLFHLPGSIDADTNAVEAHLYWGLIPLVLILCLLSGRIRNRIGSDVVRIWLVLSLCGVIYATGWLMPVTRHLPGFSFFMGPGRYTIIAALGGSILAGAVLDAVLRNAKRSTVAATAVTVMAVTLPDLLWSSDAITDAVVVQNPPIHRLEDSWVRNSLKASPVQPVRLLAPGPNVCNLYGVSCVPQYLGIGPSIYYTDKLRPSAGPLSDGDTYPDESQTERLHKLGITHVLSLDGIQNVSDQLKLIGEYPDSFLNAVWARGGAPVYLYELNAANGRVTALNPETLTSVQLTNESAGSVNCTVSVSGDTDLIISDLDYPGWQVEVDDQVVDSVALPDWPFRTVSVSAGRHQIRWSYRPLSFIIGAAISVIVAVVLLFLILRPTDKRR